MLICLERVHDLLQYHEIIIVSNVVRNYMTHFRELKVELDLKVREIHSLLDDVDFEK